MKPDIHPDYHDITITCNCGNSFVTKSTLAKKNLIIEVCSACHPFYTGTQKLLDSGGRVDKFRLKYARTKESKPVTEKKMVEAPKKVEAKKIEKKKVEEKKSPEKKHPEIKEPPEKKSPEIKAPPAEKKLLAKKPREKSPNTKTTITVKAKKKIDIKKESK